MSNEEYKQLVANLDPEIRSLIEGESDDKAHDAVEVEKEQKATREVCQRCYMLDHHNKPITRSTPEFLRATQQYGSLDFLKTKTDPLTVAVIDVTDLPGSLGQLPRLFSENPGARIMVAANKMDILPCSARKHEQRIKDWIIQHLKHQGISTNQIVSVSLISAKKGWGVPTLMRRIDEERRPTDDIYLVGCTNVGKSALVNRLMSQIRGTLDSEGRKFKADLKAKYKITSSPVPGTTMGTIKIPLHALGMVGHEPEESWKKKRFVSRDHFLIDTPGVINDQQLIHQLDYNEQKKVVNQKEMNPVTYKLEPGKSLILKPLIRVDLLESDHPVLVTLFSPLAPHMTKTAKLPAAEAFEVTAHPNRLVKDESILRLDSLEPIPGVVKVSGDHRSHGSVDFSFSGVGWVTLAGVFDRAAFRIWLPKDVEPSKVFQIREPPFLPFEYKGSIRKFFGSGERSRK
jgi:ribosome biogenesis GTPase A